MRTEPVERYPEIVGEIVGLSFLGLEEFAGVVVTSIERFRQASRLLDEVLCPHRARIPGLLPGFYTRLGAAIRICPRTLPSGPRANGFCSC